MTRILYRCLMWLHPPAFHLRFEAEMLWIFDESASTWGAMSLLADAGISLCRQWLMRSGVWKVVLAGIGGMVPLVFGFGSFIPWSSVWRALYLAP